MITSSQRMSPQHAAPQHTAKWYADWFNSAYYTTVYKHRSTKEASGVVDLLSRALSLPPGARVLDLCCGSGRHSQALAQRGFSVVGIDLSPALLKIARSEVGHAVDFHRCDMREPYPEAPYDCVANFFTSYGYFEQDTDNFAVLQRVREALKPGGFFFFDYLNAEQTRQALVPHDSKRIDDLTIEQRREITDKFVTKTIRITDAHSNAYEFTEQVRLYDINDFEQMFRNAGLVIRNVYGSYTGERFTAASPRLIIVAEAGG